MLHGNEDKDNNNFAVGGPMTFSSHKFPRAVFISED